MVQRNANIAKLSGGYLFPEINRRKNEFLAKNPSAQIISLGVGDTTMPIPMHVAEQMSFYAQLLGTPHGYSGYGAEQGSDLLRVKIAEKFYSNISDASDVFISDGAKCDIGRLQTMFGEGVTIAVQDPAYPVYVDTSVIMGQTGAASPSGGCYEGIYYIPCKPDNGFFPDLDSLPSADIIFITSPNNPTGTVLTREQLKKLVAFAKKHRSLIIFDAAYAMFIQDPELPRSIYEIEGAKEVAIELGSFSKIAGFTGVRLGWTVVPAELRFDDGSPIKNDWKRITSTFFNGASNIAQAGGLAALDVVGAKEMEGIISYYMDNAQVIKTTLNGFGFETYGGENAPYVWAHFPCKSSWQTFDELLQHTQIITTPGSGFGPSGEGFVRFSAFGHRQDILEACSRLDSYFSRVCV